MWTAVFRFSRRAFQSIPAWLLRWRPFTIFEIRLPAHIDDAVLSRSLEPSFGRSSPANIGEPASLRVEWATREQLPQLIGLSPQHLLNGWGDSSRAVVAWSGAKPVGIAWLATGEFLESELGVLFELTDHDTWLFASHVLTSHRQQGIYTRLVAFVMRESRREGKRRILLGTTHGNEPSRFAHQKMGAVAVGSMLAARVGSVLTMALSNGQVRRDTPAIAVGAIAVCRFRVLETEA